MPPITFSAPEAWPVAAKAIGGMTGYSHLLESGCFRPIAVIRQAQRRRSRRALTLCEREEISRGVFAGQSRRSIATTLGRARSTVSREINRNGGRRRYRASKADQCAWERAHRPKTCKLVQNRAPAR
jgi:hypothetical protein